MSRVNRILAALALAVLIVTVSMLGWIRGQAKAGMERGIRTVADSFRRDELLHGVGGDTLVFFAKVAEPIVQRARQNAYIKDLVVTKFMPDRSEQPFIPFTLYAELRDNWPRHVQGWRREFLGDPDNPFGALYFQLDHSLIDTMTWAIWAIVGSILLLLLALLARMWRQETSLVRTAIELNERKSELIRLERLALAGQISAGLLHDLRKPVLHIKHSLDELNDALGDFAGAASSLQDLREQTRLFFQMLQESQLERFVKSDRAGEEYVSMKPILDFSLNLVRYEQRGVLVAVRVPDDLPLVLAHPFRLIQLFSNLILNAYQALNGGGHLSIVGHPEPGGVRIDFSDDGPGISPEIQARIFDPFFTTKPEGEGSGLGLSISRLIVEDLGGRVEVESRPGGPTTFKVFLKASADTEER